MPQEMIWVPDLVLYNNADRHHYNVTIGTKATLHHSGEVWPMKNKNIFVNADFGNCFYYQKRLGI
jgi:hypothetical protein